MIELGSIQFSLSKSIVEQCFPPMENEEMLLKIAEEDHFKTRTTPAFFIEWNILSKMQLKNVHSTD